jgi:flagellar basal body rod protein FlgB
VDKVFFEDNGMHLLQRALDLSVQKQALISGNLANVDTQEPFRPKSNWLTACRCATT